MQQISNLVVEPSVLSKVPKNQQKEVMETEWLKPIKTYFPGDSFGERALYEGIDYRAGQAICVADCTLQTLNKDAYRKFIMKIEMKNQSLLRDFLK